MLNYYMGMLSHENLIFLCNLYLDFFPFHQNLDNSVISDTLFCCICMYRYNFTLCGGSASIPRSLSAVWNSSDEEDGIIIFTEHQRKEKYIPFDLDCDNINVTSYM